MTFKRFKNKLRAAFPQKELHFKSSGLANAGGYWDKDVNGNDHFYGFSNSVDRDEIYMMIDGGPMIRAEGVEKM